MAGMFDDLIPNKAPATGGGMFDDLIPQKEAPSTLGDMAHSFVTGIGKGVMGMAALPGAVTDATRYGVFRLAGMSPEQASATTQGVHQQLSNSALVPEASNQRDIQTQVEKGTGPLYQPQTTAGQYADTVGQFVPGSAIGPGGWGAKAANAILGGIGSEAAGQATKGSSIEPYARLAGALAGTGVAVAGNRVLNPQTIEGMNAGATAKLQAALGDDPSAAAAKLNELGPDGMLLHATPNLKGVAQGVAVTPGSAKDRIFQAIAENNAGRSDRLLQGTEDALGPYQSPAVNEAAVNADLKANVGPQFDAARTSGYSFDPVEQSGLLQKAQTAMAGEGQDATAFLQGKTQDLMQRMNGPNPVANVHELRVQLDDIAEAASRAGNNNAARLASKMRGIVDDAMKNVPGWAEADAKWSAAKQALADREYGYNALGGGKMPISPEQFNAETQGKNLGEIGQGMNANIRDAMGTGNDFSALKNRVGGENSYNRAKIDATFGPGTSDKLSNLVGAEQHMAEYNNDITKGSQTAFRDQGAKFVQSPEITGLPSNATFTGMAAKVAQYPFVKGANAALRAYNQPTYDALAKALTAKGADAQAILEQVSKLPPGQQRLFFAITGMNGAASAQQKSNNQLGYGPR